MIGGEGEGEGMREVMGNEQPLGNEKGLYSEGELLMTCRGVGNQGWGIK